MVHEDEVIRSLHHKIKEVKPMKWKWYWWQFRSEFLGGWQRIKELWGEIDILNDMKATYNRLKEEDEFEAMEKRYSFKEVLHAGDIITFHDPRCYGNEIEAKVVSNYTLMRGGYRRVDVIIISSGLHPKDTLLSFFQKDIMDNIIKFGGR